MAQLIVRGVEEDVKQALTRRARRHGRSTEAEVREILRAAVKEPERPQAGIGTRLAARFARIGLAEDLPELRGHPARPADLAE